MSSDSDMGTTHSSEHVVVESNDDTTTTTTPTTVPPPPTTTTTTGSDTPANNDNHDETEIPPVYLRELIAIDHASESLQSRPPRDPNDNTSNSRTIASLVFDGTPEVSSGDDDNDEDDTNALDHQEDNAINAVDATVPRANVAHDHEPQEAATDHDDDARAPSSTASIDTRVRMLLSTRVVPALSGTLSQVQVSSATHRERGRSLPTRHCVPSRGRSLEVLLSSTLR